MSTQSALKRKSTFSTKRFKPEDYQESGVQWLVDKPYAGLLWDPGLGKTATVLHAFELLQGQGKVDSLLIVATKRIANKVWSDEVAKWGLKFHVSKILGTPKERLKAMGEFADVYLTNYENLPWLCKNWKENDFGKCMLVCDESTKLKHTNTGRFKALRKHLDKFPRRVILTGTPIPNGMHDLFGQMFVVDRGVRLGQYITQFRNAWFHPTGYMGYKWELNRGAEEKIYDAVEDVINRVSAEVLNLPELIIVDRRVTLPKAAWDKYVEMENEYITLAEEGAITAANSAAARSKLRQMANGAVYYTPEEADLFDELLNTERKVATLHNEKSAELIELLEEMQGRPALIAYEFTHDRLAIEKAILSSSLASTLPRYKGEPYVPYIGGGTTDKAAEKYLDWWNAGSLPVLLGHPQSVAHGLNMQETYASVIYYALSDNLELYEQFYKRVYRKGQEHTIYLFRILAEDTVDEDIVATLEGKDRSQSAMLAAMLERTKARGR